MPVGDVCKVRIYATRNGANVDVSGIMSTQPEITDVENFGKTATFTIVNDVRTPAQNFLSASCSRWNSGTRALTLGMYVTIFHNTETSANQHGVFLITAVEPVGDLIKITCGDAMQLLRATGAEYYRTHYSGESYFQRVPQYGGWDSQLGKLYSEKPNDSLVVSADWAVPNNILIENGDRYGLKITRDNSVTFSIPVGNEGLEFINRLETLFRTDDVTGQRTTTIRVWNNSGTVDSTQTVSHGAGQLPHIVFDFNNVQLTDDYLFITFDVSSSISQAGISLEICDAPTGSTGWSYLVTPGNIVNNKTLWLNLDTFKYSPVIGNNDGNRYVVESIADFTGDLQSLATPRFLGMTRVTGYTLTGGLSMSEVFHDIVHAVEGFTSSTINSAISTGVFRCNGDNFHNYLLALADMEEPNGGRQHSMCVSPTSWGTVIMGYRYRSNDTSIASLYYGGDSEPMAGRIIMMSFAPSLSLKNRPRLAITKGTSMNGIPVMVAMCDPDVPVGASIGVLNSSVTEVPDAALSSYSNIITNRSNNWEGQIVLSGIHRQFMSESGSYIGGMPITIYDSRYGMSGYRGRVKQVIYNYSNLTTTLILNNYSEVYSNAYVDSSKMAYQAGNMSLEASSVDMFLRQYVWVRGGSAGSGSSHTIQISPNGTTWLESRPANSIHVAELGITVFSAYFPPGIATIEGLHAVTHVRVDNGTPVAIPQYRRPDKRRDQSLIVNVQIG